MLGENIRELRKRYNMTMEELGSAIGVTHSTVSMYEMNKREPNFETLIKIANYFNVTTDMLLGNVDLGLSKPIKYLKMCKKAESLNIDEESLDLLLDTLIKFKK